MKSPMKKIGLMGCGTVALYGHIPAILQTHGLVLHSVYDPVPGSLLAVREKFGIQNGFTDADEFFRSGIDAVSITSPAPSHCENVLAAAAQRLPVICEKPLALDASEASRMVAAMKTAGVPLHIAFCYRFSPSALKIRQLVRDRAVGTVRSLRLIYNWNVHGKFLEGKEGLPVINPRREGRMLEGGPMMDCGTHQIDLAHFWLGSQVTGITCRGAWVDTYEAPDHVWLHMDHSNGAHTMVEMSYSYHHTSRHGRPEFVYELIGTEGVIRYDREAGDFHMENAAGRTTFEFHEEKSFVGMYGEWERSLVHGHSDLLTSAAEGVRVLEIARAATEQAIAHRTFKSV
jgi:predicted dehydrogenase